jgi:hypothetical protein
VQERKTLGVLQNKHSTHTGSLLGLCGKEFSPQVVDGEGLEGGGGGGGDGTRAAPDEWRAIVFMNGIKLSSSHMCPQVCYPKPWR